MLLISYPASNAWVDNGVGIRGVEGLWIQVPRAPEAWGLVTGLWVWGRCVPVGCEFNSVSPHVNKGHHLLLLRWKGSYMGAHLGSAFADSE